MALLSKDEIIKIDESLEEIGKELQLIAELNSSNFSLKTQDSFDTQGLIRIGGSVLGVAGVFLTFVVPPVGIVVTIVGGLINFIGNFWKSREEKRLEAVAKISSSLESQMKEQKQSILKQTQTNLSKYCSNVFDNFNQYFVKLIQGLEAISTKLEQAQRSLDATVNYLNYGYAKRIVDWATEQDDTLNIKSAKTTIAKVKRNFGRSIDIKTQTNIELKKSCDEMKQILQEDISITIIN